jgi:DtxR family Mn-dependent transcriptional regulator
MASVSDLIDTTEMYLRTVFELEEEGVVPLRARIAERLGQSGPTVSQTVARMERDGLVTVEGDRHLELTPTGRSLATRVMRKHRLAECLLVQVIGLDWELVHEEACRWEHVMSETVERRLLDVLGHPTVSPYGNPIPGLAELGEVDPGGADLALGLDITPLDRLARDGATRVVVRRLAEPGQSDTGLMSRLRRAGVQPGASVTVGRGGEGLLVGSGGEVTEISDEVASHVFVSAV